MRTFSKLLLLAATALSVPAASQTPAAQAPRAMLAEPAMSPDGSTIAFVSGGDIWEVPSSGGTARLIVTDAATEGRPLYSPDGRSIAFTSTRGGSANVYVMELASGEVRRITYAEANEELDAWSPDGRWIYFSSAVNDVGRQPDVFRVAAAGGTPLEVSRERYLSEFQAAPSPSGADVALVARGISGVQWWRNGHSHIDETEIWLKGLSGDGGYRRLLPAGSKNAWPMWNADGTSLTFMSDRSGAENLWRVSTSPGAEPEQLTRFTDGRLLFPSAGRPGGPVVFERDMRIWRFDPATGNASPLEIALRGAPASEGQRHLSQTSFDRMDLSPDGQKVALITRGELFAASAREPGRAQRITDSVASEREVRWAPDSRRLVFVTERGDDRRLAQYDFQTGRTAVLTETGVASVPVYSPDGASLVYVRDQRELRLLRPATKGAAAQDVLLFKGALSTDEDGPRPEWSPDGRFVAFPVRDARSFVNVHVIAATGGEARPVSFLANGQMGRIAWSPDGSYILFDTAQRSEDSRIVRVDLRPKIPRYREDAFRELFKASSPGKVEDERKGPGPGEETERTGATTARRSGGQSPTPAPQVSIVWAGLRERATVLPLGMDAQSPLITADGKTLVFSAQERGHGNLYSYSLDEQAPEPPSPRQISATEKQKGDFGVSRDGKLVAWLDDRKVTTSPLEDAKPKPIAVTAEMDVDFAEQRRVVFDQAWRELDLHFHDPRFNGQDWAALRRRFEPYALASRNSDELRRVINLMIGELNASHSGINRPARGDGALRSDRVGDLGLRFDRDGYEAGRGLVIREIVPLGPVDIAGNVKPGDRLVAVDGVELRPKTNLDALLENKVGLRVALTVETAGRSREVVVRPVSVTVASGLLYRGWVADRRALVDRLSNGTLGYVHIFDMSSESLTQLYLDLDAQNQSRKGVVVDIRNNNGGFINGYALDVFSRRNYLVMTPRDLFPLPARQALGQRALGLPTVLVTNESSLSDAEDFTQGYRSLGLGKVVGQPTSGWIIYTSPATLIDGSVVRIPHTRIQDTAGQDLEMHPRPVDLAVERPLGQVGDPQLEAAVRVLQSDGNAAPPQ